MTPDVINGLFAIGGAIAGAIIGGLFTLYGIRKSRDIKKITVSNSTPAQLLNFDHNILSNIQILVSGHNVKNLLLSEVYISNIGNRAVEKLTFPMQPKNDSSILSAEIFDPSNNTQRAGSDLYFNNVNELRINIDYINPREEIVIRTILTGDSPEWQVQIRQPDLIVERRHDPVRSFSEVILKSLRVAAKIQMQQYF